MLAEQRRNGNVTLTTTLNPSSTNGVSRGPARVLERLSQAVAGLMPDRTVPGLVRARENQLPPAAQADRQQDQVQEGRRRDRARSRGGRYCQRLRSQQGRVHRA